MPVDLDALDPNATLADHQLVLNQKEALGFELITFARGVANGQKTNTASFQILDSGNPPALLTLQEIPGNLPLPAQEAQINTGPNKAKNLISYAAVFVQGAETNVAVYRG